jgi:hypothetical protein
LPDGAGVAFKYKDYRVGHTRQKAMRLATDEFIRRFLSCQQVFTAFAITACSSILRNHL